MFPFQKTDFIIFGGKTVTEPLPEALALHEALWQAGFTSELICMPTVGWLFMANHGDERLIGPLQNCRVPVFFYSEANARTENIFKDNNHLRQCETMVAITARNYSGGPAVVIEIDGQWSFSSHLVQLISYPQQGTAALVGRIFQTSGVWLFARKLTEARRNTLATIFMEGLSKATAERPLRVMIFGPGKPEDLDGFTGRIWQVREDLRRAHMGSQVLTVYGEDLANLSDDVFEQNMNPSLKERLMADQFDLIVILATSVGSAAELGVFSQHPTLCKKSLIFLLDEHEEGFMSTGAARECTNYGAEREIFTIHEVENDRLSERILARIQSRLESIVAQRFAKKTNKAE